MTRVTSRMGGALDRDFSAAITLVAGLVIALVWSGFGSGSYQRVLNTPWFSYRAPLGQINSLHHLVVAGLMTIFFFAIGLELSREVASGAFAKPSHALPPIFGALGGMVAAALLSIIIGSFAHSSALRHGWGIPMATDIAFTLGALALAGRGLPPTLRLFLLMLAVADDVFSVIVLAMTGAEHVRYLELAIFFILVVLSRLLSQRFQGIAWRLGVLVVLWLGLLGAHVEPPLAGVVAGLVIPFRLHERFVLEDHVRRWSTGIVLPLFALVSCGLEWNVLAGHAVVTITMATVAIRLIGKVLGITGGVALARLIGYRLHPSITWRLLSTSSLLCAVGFTVPLLFAGSLYSSRSPTYGAFTLGLLIASLVAASFGVVLLRVQSRPHYVGREENHENETD